MFFEHLIFFLAFHERVHDLFHIDLFLQEEFFSALHACAAYKYIPYIPFLVIIK
jgi:hypothetical protein